MDKGWVCPKCDRGVAPKHDTCPKCESATATFTWPVYTTPPTVHPWPSDVFPTPSWPYIWCE